MLVGYLRVSSADDRQTVDLQRDALLVAGVDERHFHQDKASGGREDRPGLNRLLDQLKAGDVLVVWKLDRLGRSLSTCSRSWRTSRPAASPSARSPSRSTPPPRTAVHVPMFGALAEFERALIRERTRAGLAAARAGAARAGGRRSSTPRASRCRGLGGARKAACAAASVPRSTLVDTRPGRLTGPAEAA